MLHIAVEVGRRLTLLPFLTAASVKMAGWMFFWLLTDLWYSVQMINHPY